MEKQVKYKDIEINGRNFIINKMDARTGSFMLFKVMGILGPMVKNLTVEQLTNLELDNINVGEVFIALCSLSEDDFRYIQDNCLMVVEEKLPAGPAKILDKHGNYGVLDIEDDTALIITLTIHSLVFNVKGFFLGSPLASKLKNLGLDISQLNLQI